MSSFVFNETISTNTSNYNLRSAAINWWRNQTSPLNATITIDSGVFVSTTSTSTGAFTVTWSFISWSNITIINNWTIIGKWWNGWYGGTWNGAPVPGSQWGPWFVTSVAITIQNNGSIYWWGWWGWWGWWTADSWGLNYCIWGWWGWGWAWYGIAGNWHPCWGSYPWWNGSAWTVSTGWNWWIWKSNWSATSWHWWNWWNPGQAWWNWTNATWWYSPTAGAVWWASGNAVVWNANITWTISWTVLWWIIE